MPERATDGRFPRIPGKRSGPCAKASWGQTSLARSRARDLDKLDSGWYTVVGYQVTCLSNVATIIEARCRIRRNDEAGVQG